MSTLNDVSSAAWDAANRMSLHQEELTYGDHVAARFKDNDDGIQCYINGKPVTSEEFTASYGGAKDTQIGGTHYKDMAIQPVDFIQQNGLGFCEGNVVKYICRYKTKGQEADLKKAKHYIDLLLENY